MIYHNFFHQNQEKHHFSIFFFPFTFSQQNNIYIYIYIYITFLSFFPPSTFSHQNKAFLSFFPLSLFLFKTKKNITFLSFCFPLSLVLFPPIIVKPNIGLSLCSYCNIMLLQVKS